MKSRTAFPCRLLFGAKVALFGALIACVTGGCRLMDGMQFISVGSMTIEQERQLSQPIPAGGKSETDT